MNTDKQNTGSKITIIILAILLAALAFFAYQNYTKNQDSEEVLLQQKLEIQRDLDAKLIELEDAIAENSSMEAELTIAKNNIISFRDSVQGLKTLNYKIIRRYKNKLAVLEKNNKRLLEVSDSLKLANFSLNIEIDSANVNIERQANTIVRQGQSNDSLSVQNINLSDKVAKGAELIISNISALAMRERSNGQLRETTKASRTDAFRTSFKIRANSLTTPGLKKAHIVIQNSSGKVIRGVESFTDVTGQEVQYTDVTDVEYINQDIEVIAVTDVPENSIENGDYYIKVYLENKLLGTTKVSMK